MSYLALKHAHMTLAAVSGLFFLLRWVWVLRDSPQLQRTWVRMAPHLVDTLLLALGLMLMWQLQAWPHQTPWLLAKLLALLAYIGLGVMTLRGRRPWAGVLALLVFAYMIGVAMTKSALSWWVWLA